MLGKKRLRKLMSIALLLSCAGLQSANAAPLAPGFESVTLALIADNDFSAYMGDDKNVMRLFWENNVSWPSQISAMSTQDVVPQIGETYIYVLAMGGDGYTGQAGGPGTGGQEDWAGTINRKSLFDYPGAQVAVGRSTTDARDIKLDGYLLLNNYLPNWSSTANARAEGTYSTDSASVMSALNNVIWGPATLTNHPDIADPRTNCTVSCSVSGNGFVNKGWDFPDGSAVVFRYPLSAAQLPVSATNSQVIVDWNAPTGGETPVDYLVDYKESSESDSAYKSFSVVSHPSTIETVTGLTNGTAYTFRVAGRNANGVGTYSVSRSVTPVGPPTKPLNLSYTALDGAINVKFTTPENSGGFGISNYEYSTNNGVSWTALSPPSTSDSLTIGSLTNNTSYQIRLRAVTPYGSGAQSSALSATPGVTVNRYVTYSSGTLDTVSGVPNGGTYTEGQTFQVGAAPNRSNFTFMGWSDGRNTYNPSNQYTVAAGNINLTAQWRQTSLAGTSNSDIARVLTWNIAGSEAIDATVSSDAGNSSVRVVIPSNSFDPGTEVIFWRLTNQNVAKSAINSAYDFMVNLAVSWSIGDDVTSAKRVLTSRNPVQLTITNSSIQKDATAWMIIGGVATKIGTAAQDGVINLSITEDPIITLANVSVADTPARKDTSTEEQRRIREAAKAKARAEILEAILAKKEVLTKQFQAAEINGSTNQNISSINEELRQLPITPKLEFYEVEKIVLKYLTVDKVAKRELFFYSDLAVVGLVSPQSKYKTSIVSGLKKLQSSAVDTFAEIKSAASAIEKKYLDRADRLTKTLSRIQSRVKR